MVTLLLPGGPFTALAPWRLPQVLGRRVGQPDRRRGHAARAAADRHRFTRGEPVSGRARPAIRALPREVVEGTRYVFRQPYLRAITLTTTTANFFRSGLLAVLLVYLVRAAGASGAAIGVACAPTVDPV